MAWGFRRRLKFGPLKLNLSKSGAGYFVGARGFREGRDAKGRSYTAASTLETCFYNRTYSSHSIAHLEEEAHAKRGKPWYKSRRQVVDGPHS
ncbi:MAG: DUF4236 domain-containing protein [Terracidiphilus sp.]